MSFQLSSELDCNNVFIVKRSNLEGRIDPHFYEPKFIENENKLRKIGSTRLSNQSLSIFSGITPKSGGDAYCYSEIGVPFVRSGDFLEDGELDFTQLLYIKPAIHNGIMKSSKIKKNDVLIAIVGATIGKVGIYKDNKDANINQAIAAIRLKPSLKPEFVRAFLLTSMGQKVIDRIKRPVARANLNLEEVSSFLIPRFSSVKQNLITDVMDAGYAAKKQKETEAQRLLDSIDGYLLAELGIELPEQVENALQSRIFRAQFKIVTGKRLDPIFYFSDLNRFNAGTYESESLQAVSISFVSGVGAGKQDQSDERQGIIQIRPTNINRDGALKYDKNIYLPEDFKGEKIEVDDVLFNNTNSQVLVGKTTILKEEKELFFSNHITKIKVNKRKIYPDYLEIILNAYQKSKIFYSICTNWNNQSGIGLDVLKSLMIPVPPLEKQTEIANHITQIRNQAKQLQQQAKAELEQAKKEVEAMILGEA